jgi:hypothetical protein
MHVKTVGAILIGTFMVLLAGCGSPEQVAGRVSTMGKATQGDRVFLTVDFQPGQTLRYKFTSKKNIAVDWDPNAGANANHVQEQSETFEMVVAYTPVEVDPYGVSTIRAAVESVRAVRSGGPAARRFGTDAVESAQGKSFTLKVDPRGKIVEASELTALIQEMGKQAFRAGTAMGRIKEPDMIGDFLASQWFLWDAEASVERPAEGVAVGQTWRSQLSVPTPMVMRRARNVVYKLDEVRQDVAQPPSAGTVGITPEGGGAIGPLAVITSTYTPADSTPAGWPIPYSGRFQMSGTFGFLGPYEVLGLEGTGTELFNLKAGRVEERQQKYVLRVRAGLPPLGIKANPRITTEQTLTMELMEDQIRNSNIETRNKFE